MGRSGGSSGGGGRSSGGGGGRSFGGRSSGSSRGGGSSSRSGGSSVGSSSRSGGSSVGGGRSGGLGSGGSKRSGGGFGGLGSGGSKPSGSGGFGSPPRGPYREPYRDPYREPPRPYHRPPRPPRRPYGGGYTAPIRGIGSGCTWPMIKWLVIFILVGTVITAISQAIQGEGSNITASTAAREALPAGAANETDYYTDEVDWIGNKTKLTAGMKNFYRKTGVQPYLYLTDEINGSHNPTDAEAEAFANSVYDTLFTDEAHFLLIFFEYGDQYHMWYVTGSQAKTVMDDEAADILMDYVELYYYDQSLTDEEVFSKAFDRTGERIMEVTRSPWHRVMIVLLGVIALGIGFAWWMKRKKQKNLEHEQMQEILNTPLDSFGDDEAAERAKKYEDQKDD